MTSRPGPLPRPLSEWIIGAVALVALAVVVLVVAVIWFVLWSRYGERGAQVQLDVIRTGGTLAALIGGRWRCAGSRSIRCKSNASHPRAGSGGARSSVTRARRVIALTAWGLVSTRDVFSEQELARLRGFPGITWDELIRFFTLTSADEVFVGSMRRPATMLGVAVQLCSLSWLGFVPDDVVVAPPAAVARLAERLGVPAGELAGYGRRDQTRTDHLRAVMAYRGWRGADELSLKELDEFLLARAMEHDSPTLLFRLACEHLITERVLRPGPVKLLERVAAARARAERETYDRVAHLLTVSLRADLDGLLVVDRELGMTRLRWLSTGPTEASAVAVKTEVRKLEFLRGLDAHTLDLSTLPAERRRHLAAVGRRSSVPSLTRREPHRRYPIMLTLLVQSAVDVLDEAVQLFDQAVTARESRARHKLADQLADRAKRGEDKLALAEVILPVLADPAIPDEQVGGLLRERIGMGRLAAALATPTTTRLPRDHGHLAVIDASYGYLRQFTPDVLRVLSFAGGPAAASLLEAVAVLRELNASGARTAPAGASTGFVPARWRSYLDDATATGNTTAYRHYWELCVLLCLRDALRSGDVHVPGSRRYADPTAYLIAPEAWPAQRGEFCALVGVPADPTRPWPGLKASCAPRWASSMGSWPPGGTRFASTRRASW